jgi:hypothetical protein
MCREADTSGLLSRSVKGCVYSDTLMLPVPIASLVVVSK